jgi:hypothetical protein
MFSFFYGPDDIGSYAARHRPPVLVRIGSYVLLQTSCFKYLGIFFDAGLAMELPCEIYTAKMPSKSKLIDIGGRCFLGSASILFDTAV